ncbi:MAG: hypothetical protein ACI9CU_002081, partial [Polaribacter sp.]
PNPSKGHFRISLNEAIVGGYSVYDLTGKAIVSGVPFNSNVLNLNLENQKSGLYLLRLDWEGGQKSIRLHKLD